MQQIQHRNRNFIFLITFLLIIIIALIWKQLSLRLENDRTGAIEAAIHHNSNVAVALEQHTIRTIQEADAALLLVKHEMEHDPLMDLQQLYQQGLLRINGFHGLAIADSNGSIRAFFPDTLTNTSINIRDRNYFDIHRHHRDTLYISTPLRSRSIGDDVIVISRRLQLEDGRFNGVVGIQIRPSSFMAFYRDADLNAFDIISLIAPNGITYSRRTGEVESHGENISRSPLFSYVARNPIGSYRAKDALRNQITHFSYRRLAQFPIIATVGQREEDVLANYAAVRSRLLLMGAAITVLLLLFYSAAISYVIFRRRAANILWERKLRYRSIVENTNDAILVTDGEGKILTANKAVSRIFKMDDGLPDTVSLQQLFHQSEPALLLLQNGQPFSLPTPKEHQFTCNDGSSFIGEVTASFYNDSKGKLNQTIVIRDITERKKLEELHQRAEKAYQENLTKQIIVAQEREREVIGHELHDNVNQILTTVKLYLEFALTNPQMKDAFIGKSVEQVQVCIREIRNLSHSLSAPTLGTRSLLDAIYALIEGITNCTQLRIHFHHEDFEGEPEKEQALTLYRIIQEGLNNVIKHADATEVHLQLSQNEEGIALSIQDNGKGFDPSLQHKGIGITNISSRVLVLGGQYRVQSKSGQGCLLQVSLPALAETSEQ